MFTKLDKLTHSERIIERFKELLVTRKLMPADRLPSEREMASQFGVSRASLREAISALAALGVLESRTGDGTYVSANITEAVLEPLSWAVLFVDHIGLELIEVRQLIEPGIASLAALRANESDKQSMVENIELMKRVLGDPMAVSEIDLNFHKILAEATGNRFIVEIMNSLQHLLRHLIASHKSNVATHEATLQEHIAIYEAIAAGDPVKARKALLKNIQRGYSVPGHNDSTEASIEEVG
jgi:GntR family transcriptional repressor for pyruvate dehydrogenase complex